MHKCNREKKGVGREGEGGGPHSGRGGELTSHYSHARGSRIQKRAEVRAREGRSRRRGLLSRRKVWGGRSPGLGRQGPKSGEKGGERRGIKIVRGSRGRERQRMMKKEECRAEETAEKCNKDEGKVRDNHREKRRQRARYTAVIHPLYARMGRGKEERGKREF